MSCSFSSFCQQPREIKHRDSLVKTVVRLSEIYDLQRRQTGGVYTRLDLQCSCRCLRPSSALPSVRTRTQARTVPHTNHDAAFTLLYLTPYFNRCDRTVDFGSVRTADVYMYIYFCSHKLAALITTHAVDQVSNSSTGTESEVYARSLCNLRFSGVSKVPTS